MAKIHGTTAVVLPERIELPMTRAEAYAVWGLLTKLLGGHDVEKEAFGADELMELRYVCDRLGKMHYGIEPRRAAKGTV